MDGKCKSGSNSAATIKGYEDVSANDEAALMKAVANQPVSVAVDGGDMTFQFYSGGVMTGSCGTDLDHGIAAIGYGKTSDGTKYWLMKNSKVHISLIVLIPMLLNMISILRTMSIMRFTLLSLFGHMRPNLGLVHLSSRLSVFYCRVLQGVSRGRWL